MTLRSETCSPVLVRDPAAARPRSAAPGPAPAPRRNRSLPVRVTFLLALAFAAAGCEGAGSGEGLSVRSDSAGVAIVTRTGPDVPAELAFHEEFRLGGSDSRPEEGFFAVGRGNVGVDDHGRIYVLDNSAHQVQVFDADGTHLRTLGGPGDGPGEIGIAGGLAVSPEGVVSVIDFSRRGFVRWGPDGELLSGQPFPPTFFGGIVQLSGESLTLPIRAPVEVGGEPVESLARINGADTAIVARMPPVEMRPITLASCGMSFSGFGRIFAPTLRWDAHEERVAVATSAEYDILLLEDEAAPVRVRRDLAPRAATERLAIEEQGEGMQAHSERSGRV